MSSIIEICNRALTKLGSNRITSLNDNVKGARTMAANYDPVRRAAIRAHRWSFAIVRTTLPAMSDAPAWGFTKQYQLPADNLRVDQVDRYWVWFGNLFRGYTDSFDFTPYAIESGRILTNLSAPLKVRYSRDITDPNLFDTTFDEYLACRLALEACEDLTQSSTKFQQIEAQLKDAQMEAVRANAIERPPQPLAESEWIMARF
jgi:hypothetical protein